MMTNTGSQFKYTEEKMLSINSWQEKKKLIAAKKTARGHFHKPLKMSDEDKHKFKQARECHICGRSYKKNYKTELETAATSQESTGGHLINIVISVTSDERLIKSRNQLSCTICEAMTAILLCKRLVK